MAIKLGILRWLGIICFTLMLAVSGAAQQRSGGFLGFGTGQCLLYYVSEPSRIQRFDICEGVRLADFNLNYLPDPRGVQQVQALPGGGLLAANVSVIARFNPDGTLVRIYDKPGEDCWAGLALEKDGLAFWASSSCRADVTRFDLSPAAHIFGGGSQFSSTGGRLSYGFDLHCDTATLPNYFQASWSQVNVFFMQEMTSSACTGAPFHSHTGRGNGVLNGPDGQTDATIEWTLTDNGDPGVLKDDAQIIVKGAAGEILFEASGKIVSGGFIAK